MLSLRRASPLAPVVYLKKQQQHVCNPKLILQYCSFLNVTAGTHAGSTSSARSCAGGTALRALVDGLLRALQAAAPAPATGPNTGQAPAAAPDWQLPAAATVAVTAEVLFGASPAWRPPHEGLEGMGIGDQGGPDSAAAELEALAGVVLAEWVREELWGVPTSAESAGGWAAEASAPPSLQVCAVAGEFRGCH